MEKKKVQIIYIAVGLVLLVGGLTILPTNILREQYSVVALGIVMVLGGLWSLSQAWG